MIKTFRLSEIDCPVCAGKVQDLIAAIDGVKMARVDFLALKL
ncbi:MAG: cation transporter, partial [Clostridia bacterium]|nr:cation transporter [Clostridia bacterium]